MSHSSSVELKVAGFRYARTRALADGEVEIEGCRVEWHDGGISDLNTEAFSGAQTHDVTEIGLHPFMLAYGRSGFRDYVLLPVFPLRLFRQRSIFIRPDSGIASPADLRGATIATQGYAQTSLTWIRGFLQDDYDIGPHDVRWLTSADDSSTGISGAASTEEAIVPDDITIEAGPPGLDESDLLLDGTADALFHAVEPKAFREGDPRVARLFPDYRVAERDYYGRTGIFPIMHALAVRRSLAEAEPRLVPAVVEAYAEAKRRSYRQMAALGWVTDGLPWYGAEFDETRALMGDDFYAYGMERSRMAIEALCRYSFEQGLSPTLLTVEELFHPESLDL